MQESLESRALGAVTRAQFRRLYREKKAHHGPALGPLSFKDWLRDLGSASAAKYLLRKKAAKKGVR